MWAWLALIVFVGASLNAQGKKTALLIIDVQDCFLPEGSLAVTDGEQVVPVINQIRSDYHNVVSLVVLTQDWHCSDHVSFASQHTGHDSYSLVNLTYNSQGQLCFGDSVPDDYAHGVSCISNGVSDTHSDVNHVVTQTLWPDHCVQNVTSGPKSASLSSTLEKRDTDIVVRKGYHCEVDSYSGFFDNGGFQQTELHSVLQRHDIGVVIVTGLALDFCVHYTAIDANTLGYRVIVVTDATRGVAPDTTQAALRHMEDTGIKLVRAAQLRATLDFSSRATQATPSVTATLLVTMVLLHLQV